MPSNRRKPHRPLGKRRYRKLFVIATEGTKTEPQYFDLFKHSQHLFIQVVKSKHHAPHQVLGRLKDHLKGEDLSPSDEAWLVVDKDKWTDDQLARLHAWSQEADNYGFALSNPKFEYWLLLHFEPGTNIGSSRECSARLKRHLPNYDKDIDSRKFTPDRIKEAIDRAKARDNPPCADWPRALGSTTVYKLVEKICHFQ